MSKHVLSMILSAITVGALATALHAPKVQTIGDMTGDGIADVLVEGDSPKIIGLTSDTYLFVGQRDGTFDRAIRKENNGVVYFSGTNMNYVFDGKFYKPQQNYR